MKWLALSALLLLAACNGPSGVTCPPLKEYSKSFQLELKKELEAVMDTSPNIMIVLKDYGLTRNAIRACVARRSK